MALFGAVLDACVLYPYTPRDTLLRTARAQFYRVHWTEEILEEVRRNLARSGHATAEQAQHLIDTMRDAFPEAATPAYQHLIDAMTNDPKDRHVAAAAVAASAQTIVTTNLRDFPREALAPFGIEAQEPDVFRTHFFHLDHARTLNVLERQAAAMKRQPIGVEGILNRRAPFAPTFVGLVRERRAERE